MFLLIQQTMVILFHRWFLDRRFVIWKSLTKAEVVVFVLLCLWSELCSNNVFMFSAIKWMDEDIDKNGNNMLTKRNIEVSIAQVTYPF